MRWLVVLVLALSIAASARGQTCIRGTCSSGTGVLRLPDGTELEGRFTVNGLLTGDGVIRYADGAVWRGPVLVNAPSGPGVLTETDGSVWRGAMRAGRWDGVVTIDLPDGGLRVTRTLRVGLPDGEQTWTLSGGARMTAMCRLGERAPDSATLVHTNGDRVEVELTDDCHPTGESWERAVVVAALCEAQGEARPPGEPAPSAPGSSGGPGSGAVGDLVESQRWCLSGDCQSGRGTMRLPGAETYTGDFQNGERHGQGTLTVPGQGTYTGAWERDYRHGTGEFVFENGGVFTGEFHAGSPHDGRRAWPGGEVYTGRLYRWQASGRGTFRWPDGTRHAGQFRSGEPHGQGTRTLPDGRSWTGEWAEGVAVGDGVWRAADGAVTRRGPY